MKRTEAEALIRSEPSAKPAVRRNQPRDSAGSGGEALDHALGLDEKRSTSGWKVSGLIILAILVVIVGIRFWSPESTAKVRFSTVEARRGNLTVMVTATGELKPRNQVEVGTEVSGTIETVLVDHNDRVRSGQVLAKLDTEQLEARRRQSEAALALAGAQVLEAGATLAESRNRLQRVERLVEKALLSREELDTAQATLARAEASVQIAQAQVAERQAQLDADIQVLTKAVIRAPIDGIVLRRQIEPGQTVAASLQTPVLFTLAENLTQMELYVAVDEADVGAVKEGQTARFSVDAYPDRTFPAHITQVRFAPQTVDGVVTYETILTVENEDLALRPGMTATADITVNRREDVLLVPNAALRFTPPFSEEPAAANGGSILTKLFPRRPARKDTGAAAAAIHAGSRQTVWVLQQRRPAQVAVTVGATDGNLTEIKNSDIEAGTALVVDVLGGQ